jgi:hypothetical protein
VTSDNRRIPFTTGSIDSGCPCDEAVLRGATIREVSPAVFSSGSARSALRLYKATVRRCVRLELRLALVSVGMEQEFSESQSVDAS